MKIGLAGLPGAGKTTLFHALGGRREKVPHGVTDERAVVSVEVADPRLDWLRDLHRPRKCTPARLEFCDLPGIPEQNVKGKAELLAAVRECDALAIVLREFSADPYGVGAPDPGRDLKTLQAEFLLADLALVEGRLERLRAKLSKPAKERGEDPYELALLERLHPFLERGASLRDLRIHPDDERRLNGFQLLTRKPVLTVRNVGEAGIGSRPPPLPGSTAPEIVLCAAVEEELEQLAAEERGEFQSAYGIQEPARRALARTVLGASRVHTFFTVVGEEVRAWLIPVGATALEAAGRIHSDMARGFIRVAVVAFDELRAAPDPAHFRTHHHPRLEGRDYVVRDGDILEIRFST